MLESWYSSLRDAYSMIKKFGSISVSPGKTGKYYYSEFFKHHNILAEYNPFKASNINEALGYLSNKQYSGFNISMPFKQQVIEYLNVSSLDVDLYNSCNTIKISNGELTGFNTDINSVLKIISSVVETDYVIVLGNGAMGKTFVKVLKEYGINHSVISPSLNNWGKRHEKCDILINCTSLGTSVNVSPVESVSATRIVFDLAINGYKLREKCKSVTYVSGLSFYKEVFLEQFFLHTGVQPNPDYFDYLTTIIGKR
jgi:shikimate dehydrogenase